MRETHSPLLACDQKLPDIRWGGGLYLRHLCVILRVILPFVVFISCNEILFSPILSIFRQKRGQFTRDRCVSGSRSNGAAAAQHILLLKSIVVQSESMCAAVHVCGFLSRV